MDTIFALASAPGKAGISVVRVTGPEARKTAEALGVSTLPLRGMVYRELKDTTGGILDEALILTFAGPASFTGEDVVEYQVHGSKAVVSGLLRILAECGLCRQAEPGEFTRRALENGRLDLTQVEALADLIDAETEMQRRQAQRVLSGELGDTVGRWRTDLIRAASLVEVTIDFADEDVPEDVSEEVADILGRVSGDLARHGGQAGAAERIRTGFEVAIVGAPNAGKSTVLNALAGREAAITSEYAGTTRDIVEVRMDVRGLPVTFLDTAGLRDTDDVVESIGIQRAQDRASAADIRVFLSETAQLPGVEWKTGDIHVLPKADLRRDKAGAISGLTGVGLDVLLEQIAAELSQRVPQEGLAIRFRHQAAMQKAHTALKAGTTALSNGPNHYDIVAEEIRTAIRALETLVGRIDVENLLDEIFSSFCLGK